MRYNKHYRTLLSLFFVVLAKVWNWGALGKVLSPVVAVYLVLDLIVSALALTVIKAVNALIRIVRKKREISKSYSPFDDSPEYHESIL